jgi:hypothetical protein
MTDYGMGDIKTTEYEGRMAVNQLGPHPYIVSSTLPDHRRHEPSGFVDLSHGVFGEALKEKFGTPNNVVWWDHIHGGVPCATVRWLETNDERVAHSDPPHWIAESVEIEIDDRDEGNWYSPESLFPGGRD